MTTDRAGHSPAVQAQNAPLKEKVIDAAVELFAERGYDATSVSDVINRAGVAKGGFYHHFPSKHALLHEVYGGLVSRQLAAMYDILQRGQSPAATLRALIHDLIESTAENPRQALILGREMYRLDDEGAGETRRMRRRYHETVQRLVCAGQERGEFTLDARPETVAFVIFSTVSALPLWYGPSGHTPPAQLAGELADLIMASVEVRE